MFVSIKKYNDLVTFCSREQARYQHTENLNAKLIKDVEFWKGQSAVYKERAERLEQEAKSRAANGQYNRVIPIVRIDQLLEERN